MVPDNLCLLHTNYKRWLLFISLLLTLFNTDEHLLASWQIGYLTSSHYGSLLIETKTELK